MYMYVCHVVTAATSLVECDTVNYIGVKRTLNGLGSRIKPSWKSRGSLLGCGGSSQSSRKFLKMADANVMTRSLASASPGQARTPPLNGIRLATKTAKSNTQHVRKADEMERFWNIAI